MKEFIIANYDGRALTTYKGDWKRHFKQTLKLLNRKYGRCTEEAWSQIIDTVLRADKSSTSTRTSNRQISEEEKRVVIEIFNNIKDSDKWVLSTGKIVDDIMRVCVEESFYEHPVHSLILDPSDLIWKKHFTVSELKEISAVNTRPLDEIPSELQQYINSYTACKTAMDLRKYVFSHCFDPIEEFDKKWVQESILAASNLFNYNKLLDTSDYSEADLLHRIWPFVYNLFQDNEIKAKLGERCSVAVAVFKNGNRSLETNEKRPRKNMGAKLDILFKCGSVEVGSSEVGKDDVIEADDKYFDDGLVKLPKTLRDMLAALVRKNPAQINGLTTVGYLMMGK
jgi:hypothetical protein